MKILFLTSGSEIVASSRTRVYQYLPYLKKAGTQYLVIPMSSKTPNRTEFRLFRIMKKEFNNGIRYLKIALLSINYDVVFIQKNLLPNCVQDSIKLLNKNIVYDFDDAIYVSSRVESSTDNYIHKRKRLEHIIRISKYIVLENSYTKEFASRFNKNILMITGPIDCKRYFPIRKQENKNIVIGWIGSSPTTIYLESLINVFKKISGKYPEVIFELIGVPNLTVKGVNVKIKKWSLDTEVKDLQNFDIGIMPLPDDEWTRGKGGYKLLQYMAVGIPCVASPVGINREIICDGINGFLADSESEWEQKLSVLIENRQLRLSMGCEGRNTVVNKYSFDVSLPILMNCLRTLER